MVTLTWEQMEELEKLEVRGCRTVRPPLVVDDAKRLAKLERRAARWARVEGSVRDGLKYSRGVVRRMVKHKGDGGAKLEWQLSRIIR